MKIRSALYVHEHLSWIVVSLKVSCISLFYSIACRRGREKEHYKMSQALMGKSFDENIHLKYEGVPALTCTETCMQQI